MPAATFDIVVEQGVPLSLLFAWCVDDADQTPIPLAGRVPYMAFLQSGVTLLDSAAIGGITVTPEPGGAVGQVGVLISGGRTKQMLRPYGDVPARYRLNLTDPADSENVVELVQGLVLVAPESQ